MFVFEVSLGNKYSPPFRSPFHLSSIPNLLTISTSSRTLGEKEQMEATDAANMRAGCEQGSAVRKNNK